MANILEMNKIGFSKDGKQEPFYTSENWGKMNEKSWGSSQEILNLQLDYKLI